MTEKEIIQLIEDRKANCTTFGMGEDFPAEAIRWELDNLLREIVKTNEERNELLGLPQYQEAKAKCEEMEGVITKIVSCVEMPKGYKLSFDKLFIVAQ